mgnify:CR=1 FL=1
MIKEKIMLSFSQVVYSLRRPWKSGFKAGYRWESAEKETETRKIRL